MNISLYLVAALGSGKADLLHACDVCCSGSGGFFIELDLSLLRRELAQQTAFSSVNHEIGGIYLWNPERFAIRDYDFDRK